MKKLFYKTLLLILTIAFAQDIMAHDFEVNSIYYNITSFTNKTVEVTRKDYSNNSYSGFVVIPATVEYSGTTYSVTTVGQQAFYGSTGLTTVIIPSSVTSIGNNAFYGCSGLTSINIPSSVTSIGNNAFYGCSGLTSINIPNGVTSIGNSAFEGCSGLTSINIPNSVTFIGSWAFADCNGLTSINIPNGVKDIGYYAFSYCHSLTSINIPSSVTSIGNYAFYYCNGLTSINISSGVTSIGNYAFGYCSGLTSVTIPNSVTSIGKDAFFWCSGLTSINIPSSVTSIGDYAFFCCEKITSVTNLAAKPQNITSGTFSTFGTLHVCEGLKDAYQQADIWNKFTIVDDIELKESVSVPTISFANGKLHFSCETEGVEFHYSIEPKTTMTNTSGISTGDVEIKTEPSYTVTCYATKEGFLSSPTVIKTITPAGTDVNHDGSINVLDVNAVVHAICSNMSDDTSQYITNANFANGLNGWTASNFATPVASSNTYATEAYAGYDNLDIETYSIQQTVTLSKGRYRLKNYGFFRYGLTYNVDPSISRCELFAGDKSVKIKTLGSISANSYANTQQQAADAFANGLYRNSLEFTVEEDNTPVTIGLRGTFDLKQSWCTCGPFTLETF